MNTVDSFQGGERDIVILSTVRTNPSGFLGDPKRVNVALTRARHHLIIVGHHSTMLHSTVWKPVVNFVSSKCPGCFFPTDDAFLSALTGMQAVQLAVAVSQRDGSAQVEPSETCKAAGRRKGGGQQRGGRRATWCMVWHKVGRRIDTEEVGEAGTRTLSTEADFLQADSAELVDTSARSAATHSQQTAWRTKMCHCHCSVHRLTAVRTSLAPPPLPGRTNSPSHQPV